MQHRSHYRISTEKKIDTDKEDQGLDFVKLQQAAKSFVILVILTLAEALFGIFMISQSFSLGGNFKMGAIVAGVAFLLLAAVSVIPCKVAFKAQISYRSIMKIRHKKGLINKNRDSFEDRENYGEK